MRVLFIFNGHRHQWQHSTVRVQVVRRKRRHVRMTTQKLRHLPTVLFGAVALLMCMGCESYKKTGWYTPDGFNYTFSRSRDTGELIDAVGFSWTLK